MPRARADAVPYFFLQRILILSTRQRYVRHRLGPKYLPLLAVTAWHGAALAAEPTTAGTLLRQNADVTRGIGTEPANEAMPVLPSSSITPASSAGDELSFVVDDFDFGGTLSDAEQQHVDALVAPWRGQSVTLGQLQTLRDELTAVLYNGGDSLVRVALPPQTVTNGIVRFEVQRGHVESIEVTSGASPRSPLATERLRRMLASTDNDAPTLRDIERNARFVEGIPGVGSVSSSLSTGTQPGGTIVDVEVTPADRFHGAATIDNAGSPQAGWRRLGLSGALNDTLGLGDQLQAIVYTTPRAMQTRSGEDGRTRLGRLSYDLLTGYGWSRAGIAFAHVDYALGGDFSGLGTGSADVASLYGAWPVLRDAGASLDLGAGLEARRATDQRFDHILVSRQRSVIASLRADGSLAGHWGERRNLLQYGAVASQGTAKLNESDNSGVSPLLSSRSFHFFKLEPSAAYAQSVTPTTQLTVTLRGQWSSHALDGSQRLGLGGPTAVRAYDQNAAAVDDGLIASVTASQSFRSLPGAAVQLFYDGAYGRTRSGAGLPGGSAHLQGYGVGVSYSGKHASAQLSYAMRAGHAMDNTARHQTWISLTTTF